MLKKLIKHEFKATSRFFLTTYIIFTALLVLERFSLLATEFWAGTGETLSSIVAGITGILTFFTILAFIALLAAPFFYNIYRFYRNMLSDEGYLSFTLPVTTAQHLWSKVIVGVLWNIITSIVVILLGILFAVSMDPAMLGELFNQFGMLWAKVYEVGGQWLLLTILMLLISVPVQQGTQLLFIYNAMSVGQCANKHKKAATIGFYFGFNFIISSISQSIMTLLAQFGGSDIVISLESMIDTAITAENYVVFFQLFCFALLITLIFNLLLAALHFFLANYFLTKKLNLA